MTTQTETQTQTQHTLPLTTSSSSAPAPSGPVTATLNFYSPPTDGSKPFNYVETPPPGEPKSNYSVISIDVPISDLRGHEADFTLDHNAFATLANIPSQETEWNDDAHIKSVYYPEVEKLVLDHVPGAKRVLLFDHTIRRADPGASRAPVTRAHIDQTPASAAARVRHHLPDEADTLLQGRYRIINIWRPINGVVESFPLAVADSATVRDEDLVGIEHRYPDRTGETAGVKYSERQKWWYWSGMGDEERLLLLCFDSQRAEGRVPHSAFEDLRKEGAKGRESIEVRALVFE
ncbi:hypothetical protein MMC30_001997 [Trapelia coarctata]|nr:hypothetical protein [Trapelia coarctata]